jgi:SAM-dependent methyltransferase
MSKEHTQWPVSTLSPVGSTPLTAIEVSDKTNDTVQQLFASDMGPIVDQFTTAHALYQFSISPLYKELRVNGTVDVPDAARKHELQEVHAAGLLRFLAIRGFFTEEPGAVFRMTPKGRSSMTDSALGLLTMYIGGYGNLMARANDLLQGKAHYGGDIERDSYRVGLGSSLFTSAVTDEVPFRIFERRGVRTIADLGCGAGKFLIAFAKRHPSHRGIGIDISEEGIANARADAERQGVGNQLQFVVGNCFDSDLLKKTCAEVESFYSFGFEHELLRDGEDALLEHIDGMASILPGKSYLLGEVILKMAPADAKYYWIHVLSHQGIPRNIPGWCELLGKLRRAKLKEVFVPDHQELAAFYEIGL